MKQIKKNPGYKRYKLLGLLLLISVKQRAYFNVVGDLRSIVDNHIIFREKKRYFLLQNSYLPEFDERTPREIFKLDYRKPELLFY